jgi:hypothetical protein
VAKLFAKRFAVVRFTSAGVLDTAFGTDGLATATFAVNSNERAFGVGIGQGGNIVLAGDTSMTTGAPAFAVTRFTSSGALDKSFNGTGIVTTPIRKLSTALAMTFTSENDLSTELITVAGFSDGDFALARYWP